MPFRNVYFTGIIRDKQGRKMSKTLGNSPDPLDLIARYGADALRFGTMRSAPLGQDVLFDEKDVELGRNFCNKLWNACRFRQMQGGEVQGELNPALLSSDDRWILLRLDQAIREVSEALASYNFATAVQTLYRFFWSEYCDWYVEASKAALQGGDGARKANTLAVIDFVLGHTLRLFHPFLPFITEELWHGLGYNQDLPEDQGGQTIMTAHWPAPLDPARGVFRLHLAAGDGLGAVFHVYDRLRLSAGPRRYTVEAGKALEGEWLLQGKDRAYDLWVLGPGGFHRAFVGRGGHEHGVIDGRRRGEMAAIKRTLPELDMACALPELEMPTLMCPPATCDAVMPACTSAALAASTAMSMMSTSSGAQRRCLMPVRSWIHSSEESMRGASSSLVTRRSGRYEPRPTTPAARTGAVAVSWVMRLLAGAGEAVVDRG